MLERNDFEKEFSNWSFPEQTKFLEEIALNLGKEGISLYEHLSNVNSYRTKAEFESKNLDFIRDGKAGYISGIKNVSGNIIVRCLDDKICTLPQLEDIILEGNLSVIENILDKLREFTYDELDGDEIFALSRAQEDGLLNFGLIIDIGRNYELVKKRQEFRLIDLLKRVHKEYKIIPRTLMSADKVPLNKLVLRRNEKYFS